MAAIAGYLVETSAAVRASEPAAGGHLKELRRSGSWWSCAVVDLEALYSARSAEDHRALRDERRLGLRRARIDDAVLDRAIEVQGLLADRGQHRAVPIPDLVIAAAAESAGLGVLHHDADFDRIAAVTGQPVEWVAPRGSLG